MKKLVKRVSNLRDLGCVANKNNKILEEGLLYRSSRLEKANKRKLNKFLEEKRITKIIDFRTPMEVSDYKPLTFKNTEVIHLPLLNQEFFGITHEKNMKKVILNNRKLIEKTEDATLYMQRMFQSILLDPFSISQLQKFFQILIEKEPNEAILFHCNAGKDRTGLGTMLIYYLLDMDEDLIIKDFLLTNEYMKFEIFKKKLGINLLPSKRLRKLLRAMLYAKASYLTESLELLKKKFGSVDNYIKDVLKLDDDFKIIFQNLYLK